MSDLATQLNNFRNAIQIQGEQDEGSEGSEGDLFGTGDTYESATFPKAVEINDNTEGEGQIRYPFDYRVRHKHYIARIESATDDTNSSGMITASYIIGRSGKVYMADIRFEIPQNRAGGNCIINRLQSMNGQIV